MMKLPKLSIFTCLLVLFWLESLLSNGQVQLHFQQTVVSQTKHKFDAPYSGINSLLPNKETQASITSTLFTGTKLWKGAEAYLNIELSGGSGLSGAKGIAGFTNGEAFRIGDASPKIYLARGYLKQTFNLSDDLKSIEDSPNQIKTTQASKYVKIVLGKFCLTDFFDLNQFSHDPRTQFLNWSLMSHGAWDYAANVRGYTVGGMIEYGSPKFGIRWSMSALPTTANGPNLDYQLLKHFSQAIEIEHRLTSRTVLRLLGYYNQTYMGNYAEAIERTDKDLLKTRQEGRTKIGLGINAEHKLNDLIGIFSRLSYNDGKNETWAFTEIDNSYSLGAVFNGGKWNRKDDNLGLACVSNGISNSHQQFLKSGGNGFMIGDGALNYRRELIAEIYYSWHLHDRHFWLSPDFQWVKNPAYNVDRGAIKVFSLRAHAEF